MHRRSFLKGITIVTAGLSLIGVPPRKEPVSKKRIPARPNGATSYRFHTSGPLRAGDVLRQVGTNKYFVWDGCRVVSPEHDIPRVADFTVFPNSLPQQEGKLTVEA